MKKLPEHLIEKYNAVPLTDNVISGERYRFTVITSRLLRLEYSEGGNFTDMPTQSIICRNLGKVDFNVIEDNDNLTITTADLTLNYKKSGAFTGANLSVSLNKLLPNQYAKSSWNFGDKVKTLGGTARTLDGIDGALPLDDGVCARCGYAFIDDSTSNIIRDDGMIASRQKGVTDIYFFGYGHDYLSAIKDLQLISGIPPLLPAYALGNWWSRYYKYTQQEYIDLMTRFKDENIPFTVSVIDMDWHKVNIPEEFGSGWTGYSWNTDLFPDYKAFLKWLQDNNLKITLNLHPALGVRAHEDMYADMARDMGIDPESKEPISFDMTNPEFIKAYFEFLHNPYEKDGVSFWWMDWQQGTKSAMDGLDPLWMLNHYHTLDVKRDGKRPMLLSRFAGVGSQRFPVGFSGDTIMTWKSLEFQPYFTATASNVAYGWWSHDIGAHFGGYRDDDLTARWVQYGVFSPINRLHSSNSPFSSKEPWNYSASAEKSIKASLTLRHKLFPYLYTMNMRAHKDLIPLVCPVYYHHPDNYFAYRYPNEFFFGDQMLLFPITSPCDKESGLAKAEGWLPEGMWIDFMQGGIYKGGCQKSFYRNLYEYPVLCKAGAIIPCNTIGKRDNLVGSRKNMEIYVFPGKDNSFTLYEDSGDNLDYQSGAFSTTEYTLKWGDSAIFEINAAQGDISLIPESRNYQLHFRGFSKNCAAKVTANGSAIDFTAKYDQKTNTFTVTVLDVATVSNLQVEITSTSGIYPDDTAAFNRVFEMIQSAQTDYNPKNDLWSLFVDPKFTKMEKLSFVTTFIKNQSLVSAITEQLSLM